MAYDKLVDSAVLDATFTGIADAIREKIGSTEKISQDDMAEKIPIVYGTGHTVGFIEGQADGIEQGKQAEYDRFWDAYQQNGNRTNYNLAFAGIGWNKETFKPKYLITPAVGNTYQMFARTCVEVLDETVLDFSKATTAQMSFYQNDYLKDVTLDISSLRTFADLFINAYALETLVLKNVPETCNFTGGFTNCTKLKNFTVTGTIGGTTVNLQWSNLLTADSAKNLIQHLKNHAGTDKANTCTIRFHDNVWTKLDAEGNTAPHGGTWKDYVANTLCWNT